MAQSEWDKNRICAMLDQGRDDELAALLESGKASMIDSLALRLSAAEGKLEWVRLLIPGSDPAALESAALCSAATEGHFECAQMLLPLSTACDIPEAFVSAALMGEARIVELLGPRADAKGAGQGALAAAVDGGDFEAFMAALRFCDADAQRCEALKKALASKQRNMVKQLASRLDRAGPHWNYALAAAIAGDDPQIIELGIHWLEPNSERHRAAFRIAIEHGSPAAVTLLAKGLDVDETQFWSWPTFESWGRNSHKKLKGDFDGCFLALMGLSSKMPAKQSLHIANGNAWPKSIRDIASRGRLNGLFAELKQLSCSLADPEMKAALEEGLRASDAAMERTEIAQALLADESCGKAQPRL